MNDTIPTTSVVTQTFEEAIESAEAYRADLYDHLTDLEPSEFLDYLEKQLDGTDVIVDGIGISTQVSEGSAIMLNGILCLRHALEIALGWIDKQYFEDEEDSDVEVLQRPDLNSDL